VVPTGLSQAVVPSALESWISFPTHLLEDGHHLIRERISFLAPLSGTMPLNH